MDGVRLQDPFGRWGGGDAAPAGGVRGDVPAEFACERLGRRRGVHLADEIRGPVEGGIVGPHEGVGGEGGDTTARERVVKRTGQQRADHALGLGTQQVQGVGSAEGGVGRALHGEQADLRAVAVGDDQLVFLREGRQGGGDPVDVGLLDSGVRAFAAVQQGVAKQARRRCAGAGLRAALTIRPPPRPHDDQRPRTRCSTRRSGRPGRSLTSPVARRKEPAGHGAFQEDLRSPVPLGQATAHSVWQSYSRPSLI